MGVLLVVYLLLPTLAGAQLGIQAKEQQQPSREPVVTIDGKTHPELIPEQLAWEVAFRFLGHRARLAKEDSAQYGVDALSRKMLHIPPDEVKILLSVADDTLRAVDVLRKPLRDEHAGQIDLGWSVAQRRNHQQAIAMAFLDGRDELAYRLPRRSFKALKRWVAKEIIPGMQVDVSSSGGVRDSASQPEGR